MKRALGVFAKSPVPGRVKTRLSPHLSHAAGAELYRCMLLDVLDQVSGLDADPVIFYDGARAFFAEAAPGAVLVPQPAADLGMRLQAAFALLAEVGYDLRVVIGSDAPDLPPRYIEEAFAALAGGVDAVFGPAEDGGYYLVGLKGGDGGIFRDIPWSSCSVLEASLSRAAAAGLSTLLLPGWYDVDRPSDLLRPSLRDPAHGASRTRAFLKSWDNHLPA